MSKVARADTDERGRSVMMVNRACPVCAMWMIPIRRGALELWECRKCGRVMDEEEYWERLALEEGKQP